MAYIKDYWENKESRAELAKMHTADMEQKFDKHTKASVRLTRVYGGDIVDTPEIELVDMDSVKAAFTYRNGRTAVLNFASFKHPGGMFLSGSKAQEECLCHASNLYNVLREFEKDYYEWNKKNLNKALYKNRGLYSPDIVFEYEGRNFACDVITCAAPNKSAAQQYQGVSDEENSKVLRSRIKFVLDMATVNKVDTLILGAYGCGVFGQDATEVASIFKEMLQTTHRDFKKVVFAVPKGNNDNYAKFEKVFS